MRKDRRVIKPLLVLLRIYLQNHNYIDCRTGTENVNNIDRTFFVFCSMSSFLVLFEAALRFFTADTILNYCVKLVSFFKNHCVY